ncbi:MAG: hypothetical protein ABJE95_16635 [Byssovorax sp.]
MIPEIAHLHPKITELHTELLGAQPDNAAASPALQVIIDAAVAADALHDPLARAIASGITADRDQCLAAEPPDQERAGLADQVQSKLFPGGMTIVNASLLAESGSTARVARLLDDEPQIGVYLKSIPLREKHTLLDTTHRWIAAGTKLGKLETAREEQEAKEATTPLGRAAITALRSRWMRLVSQVLSNLELSDAPAESIEVIRGPVMKAADRAGKRYEPPAATPADAPAEGVKPA